MEMIYAVLPVFEILKNVIWYLFMCFSEAAELFEEYYQSYEEGMIFDPCTDTPLASLTEPSWPSDFCYQGYNEWLWQTLDTIF